MKNDISEQEIKNLIIDEKGYIPIQELVAELILRTADLNSEPTQKRYKQAIGALLGSGKSKNNKFIESIDRAYLLGSRLMINHGLATSPELSDKEMKALRGEARKITEDWINEKIDKKVLGSDDIKQQLIDRTDATQRTLKNQRMALKQNISEYANAIGESVTKTYEDWSTARNYISIWLKKYPSTEK